MTLLCKQDKLPYEIYDISYDSKGYPMFLIYKDKQWKRMSAKHFTPNYYEDDCGEFVVDEYDG